MKEVNLLSLYRKKTFELVKESTVKASFGDCKLSNLATHKSLLIDDICTAIKLFNKEDPNSYLTTRFYNRATKKLDINWQPSWKINNVIVENVSRGGLDEDAKNASKPNTHYAIPSLLHGIDSNFDAHYKIPPGFMILFHKGKSSADEVNVFKLMKPLEFTYTMQEHSLRVRDNLKPVQNMLRVLGNLNSSNLYCLGDNSRNINAMMLWMGSRFGTDYINNDHAQEFTKTNWKGVFDKFLPKVTASKEEITQSIKGNGLDKFFSEVQAAKLSSLKDIEECYTLDY